MMQGLLKVLWFILKWGLILCAIPIIIGYIIVTMMCYIYMASVTDSVKNL